MKQNKYFSTEIPNVIKISQEQHTLIHTHYKHSEKTDLELSELCDELHKAGYKRRELK